MKGKLNKCICLGLLLVLLASCHRGPLYVDLGERTEVVVVPDWSGASMTPDGCEALVYSDGQLVKRALSHNPDSISVPLGIGRYKICVFSYSEAEYWSLHFSGAESLAGFTIRSGSRDDGSRAEAPPLLYEPEWIATGMTEEFDITENMLGERYAVVQEFNREGYHYFTGPDRFLRSVGSVQKDIVKTLLIRVWTDSPRTISTMEMNVEGVSVGWSLPADAPLGETGTLYVPTWKRTVVSDNLAHFDSSIRCFGFPGDGTPETVTVELVFNRSDGSVYDTFRQTVPVNLTENTIEIVIGLEGEPIVLPQLKGSNGDFGDVWVDGWDNQNETTIDM